MDCIWFYRNQIVHGSPTIPIDNFIKSALNLFQEHRGAWNEKTSSASFQWTPPVRGKISVSFDVAVRPFGSTIAAVCRDHLGNILACATNFTKNCNPNNGEALAALLGIRIASEKEWKSINLEGDSQVVISALNNPLNITDWAIEGAIQDSRTLLRNFDDWKATKIHRDQNRCAHQIAQWASSNSVFKDIPLNWIHQCLLEFHSGKDPPSV
ncbi:uncharacterized protein LOC122307983 [Carya illinoinensis]|uniref:uncharacterized protein LOC122307983 n=1 Tax=Carya illinoinensis TaxID=32201 RepID=UPI001C71BE8C|nr:uncharacterized protein LOC122307983 [Carya illinoinensis]